MITVNVNLIGFSTNNSVGTLIFTKRLFRQIFNMPHPGVKFIFYAQECLDFKDFKLSKGTDIVRVPNMKYPLQRLLYEQTIFRSKLKNADYIFTPYLTIPLLFTTCKQIVAIHDMVPFMIPNKYSAAKLKFIKCETRFASKFCDKIVTVSDNSKKDICNITGTDPNKVVVIYNFIRNDEETVQGKTKFEVVKGLGLSKPYFITVATLQPGKNIERLIRSFGKFINSGYDYQLCIVGNKGWGFASIYEEVKKCKLEKTVIFTGYTEDDTLDILYTHCYGVVYVSLYEGFGIPPLEGFYHNKSAIVSFNSSLPEVVGDAAILVDPTNDDSITEGFEQFIKNKDLLESNVHNQIAKFNPELIASKFLNIFR